MENDHHHYELRSGSRSRSQTPLVQNRALITEADNGDRHYDLRGHSRERSHTPGDVGSNRRSGSRSLPSNAGKPLDHTMAPITENREDGEAVNDNRSHRSESSTSSSVKKVERRSERQKAKRQVHANGQSSSKEDSVGQKLKDKHKSLSPRRIMTSDYSSEDDSPKKLTSAHEIYKRAGDWWNVFPKTDYTYSEKSECRYEIAPGVLAMPNMSRRSIHANSNSTTDGISSISKDNYSQSTLDTYESGLGDTLEVEKSNETSAQNLTSMDKSFDTIPKLRTWNSEAGSKMLYSKTHVARYRSHREIYTVPDDLTTSSHARSPSKRIYSPKYQSTSVDSDSELEDPVFISTNNFSGRLKVTQWFSSIAGFIALWFNKMLEFLKLKTVRNSEYRSYQYRRYQEPKWYDAWRYVDRSLQYIYLIMVRIFMLDSWLLSRVSSITKRIQRKGPKLFWIAVLPLLLLTGCWCLPYLKYLPYPLPSLSSTKVIKTEEMKEGLSTSNGEVFIKKTVERSIEDKENFKEFADKLSGRVDKLEGHNTEQAERLLNIARMLEELKKSDVDIWSQYNNKIMVLEKKLKEDEEDKKKSSDTSAQQIHTIKHEFETLKELYSQLKSCCNTHTEASSSQEVEERVEKILVQYFGGAVSKNDLTRVIQKLIDAENSGDSVNIDRRDVIVSSGDVTEKRVHEIVREALKTYDADKTGRVDYALESAGGQVISTRCTQKYDRSSRAFKILTFTVYHENNNPRTVIQGNPIQPGACWAFQGFPGYLLIKLRSFIYVTGFTMEHAPKSILPNGEMKSAPRKFNVWGFTDENDPEPVLFGDYEFVASDDNLQYFPIQNTTISMPYQYVELRVHSNHGELEYTSLYRFRVHGKLA